VSGTPERTHHIIPACNGIPHPKVPKHIGIKKLTGQGKTFICLNSTTTTTTKIIIIIIIIIIITTTTMLL